MEKHQNEMINFTHLLNLCEQIGISKEVIQLFSKMEEHYEQNYRLSKN